MDYEKYSVLMSVYYKERPEWLSISIESMLAQTVPADEFVIIKDGELTQELEQILDEYKKKYPQLFNIIGLKNNVGLGPALEFGIKECKNELIARMDSDDYSSPNRCQKQLEIFEKYSDYDAVGSYEIEFEDELNNIIAIHRVPESSEDIYEFMKRRCALLHPTIMYKKSTIITCGNYRDVPLYEDYDLFMRLVVQNKAKCYNIPEPLYYLRINSDFFKRRGGISYMRTAIKFKKNQYKKGYMSLTDFLVSAGSQAIVCLLPNKTRRWVYLKFLR